MARSKQVQSHWDAVAGMGCCICRAPNPSLHHAYGPSMQERGVYKGMGQKTSDWLVIPLCHHHHQGRAGIHTLGVKRWEREFMPQAQILDEIGEHVRLDLFALAAPNTQRWG